MDAITIEIFWSDQGGDEGGYMYNIYGTDMQGAIDSDGDSDDGGLCTGTIADAIEMATAQAKELIARTNKPETENKGDCYMDVFGKKCLTFGHKH